MVAQSHPYLTTPLAGGILIDWPRYKFNASTKQQLIIFSVICSEMLSPSQTRAI